MSAPFEEMYNAVTHENVQSVFEAVDELNTAIADQNRRYEAATVVFADEPELLELAAQSIADEQKETFTDLSQTVRSSDNIYTTIGELSCLLDKDIARTEAAIEELEEESETQSQQIEALKREREISQRSKYDELIQQVEELAPKALDKARQLLQERLDNDISSDEVRELEDAYLLTLFKHDQQRDHHELLQSSADDVQSLIERGGQAWPLPLALMGVHGADTSQWVIDELPVEPKLNPSGHDRYVALRERHVDQPEASLYAAIYLTDNSGQTVTVDDLARFLYSDEVVASLSDHHMRSRVTTLLGPIAGECLHKILDSEGYVLQYGWRRILEKNGGDQIKVKSRYRIYRAISLDELDLLSQENTQSEEGAVDEFEITPEIEQLMLANGNAAQESSPDDEFEPHEKVPSWFKELKRDIGRELDLLEESGLLVEEKGVTLKVIRTRSSSRSFVTEDSLEQVRSAGFLRRFNNINRSNWWSEVVTPAEMVLISLFNTNQDLLGKNQPRRRRAYRTIEDAVTNYFEHQREKAKV